MTNPQKLVSSSSMHCCPHNPQEALELGLAQMSEAGLKKTKPRLKLLELLTALAQPASAEELHCQLGAASVPSDLATVYRNLHTFCDLGLIERLNFSDGSFRYEWKALPDSLSAENRKSIKGLSIARTKPTKEPFSVHHHHHVICTSCKKIEAVNLCWGGPEEKKLRARGYRDITHRLEFFALCPDCA